MFSGIIEELGIVKSITRGPKAFIHIQAQTAAEGTRVGDSISVNGVCLTVVKKTASSMAFETMPETLKATNLGSIKIFDKVNLERALKIGDRLSGHFVTGHVDCAGVIRSKGFKEGNVCFDIAVGQQYSSYILPKGSIAVDGISLTVMARKPGSFSVYLIGHTLKNTTLGFKGPSDRVNVEFDILAKKARL